MPMRHRHIPHRDIVVGAGFPLRQSARAAAPFSHPHVIDPSPVMINGLPIWIVRVVTVSAAFHDERIALYVAAILLPAPESAKDYAARLYAEADVAAALRPQMAHVKHLNLGRQT